MSQVITNKEVAETFQQYANHVQDAINAFNRADTLPVCNVRAEIRARKIAAEILHPIQQLFATAAQNFGYEAALEIEQPQDMEPIDYGQSFY
ncbi:MAG: hypothetical protein FWD27_00650 [Coriobacteriia bacterium]|nr:hypothetical protein [Coriobacteriia bacterium]